MKFEIFKLMNESCRRMSHGSLVCCEMQFILACMQRPSIWWNCSLFWQWQRQLCQLRDWLVKPTRFIYWRRKIQCNWCGETERV